MRDVTEPLDNAVDAMASYYAKRAAIYERVYHKPERQADLRAMEAWLPGEFAGRHVLEIACGTGWWTLHGARDAASWLATDLNPETMAVARAKPMPAAVTFRTMDAYTLQGLDDAGSRGAACFDAAGSRGAACFDAAGSRGAACFDAAFAGCWWSHVPLSRLGGWLAAVHARLAPGARVVMLDNAFVPGSSTPIHRRDAEGNTYQLRTLDDGSTHEVLKNFPSFEQACAALGPLARDARWHDFHHYWALSYTLADQA